MHKLHYVNDAKPGFTRQMRGKQFVYYDEKGKKITDFDVLKRVRSLAIPPAYRDVWICPSEHGHLQATGIDAKGRKQYRYHPEWRARQEETKFEHILYFGERLPAMRDKVAKDMHRHGLAREKVLATVVELLEKTLIRVGNSEYARDNKSYGLTTLKDKHVKVKGSEIRFVFTGKSGKKWDLSLHDRRIAAVVKRCADIPGHELFKYVDEDGKQHDVTSADINGYLKNISGEDFTAKDYRTWSGTVLAAMALQEFEAFDTKAQAKKNVLRAIEKVASRLGNTPSVCRKAYIHPEIINAYLDGEFRHMVEHEIDKTLRKKYDSLKDEELLVLMFLRKRLAAEDRKHSARKGKPS